MCRKVRRNCCHFPSSRGDRPSRLWQDGWYVKRGPHNQATKYLATTDNNISCSKLIYRIDLVCSLADHTKKSLLHPLTFTHKIALCPFKTCCIYSLQQTPTPTRGPQTLPRLAGSACLLALCAQQGLILKLLAQSEQFESLNVLFVCLVQWCHLQRFEKQQCTCHFREWSHHFLFQAVQPPIHVFSNDHAVITNKQQTQLCVSLIK